MKTWIAEQTGRYRKTLLVTAKTRAEAQRKLDQSAVMGTFMDGVVDAVDIDYYCCGSPRVLREDRKRK